MADKSDNLYLRHINDACKQVGIYIQGVGKEEFETSRLLQDGVIRQLEIIGEAARQVPQKTRESYPDILIGKTSLV